MDSLLYVFLPCKKVYPTGITYLADFIHRRRPEVRQQILDLSLFPVAERSRALRDTVRRVQAGARVFFVARHSDFFAA